MTVSLTITFCSV